MSMPVKDLGTASEPKSGAAKPGRRDAVGAEIPVTIHASRTTQGMGKNLPSVHEDTKTVIVLQAGAVVRLTASLTTGETVVLTNRMTGSDVLCRVGNVKSQPGIQHYVDLEFIQRAPGFWGDTVASASAPIANEVPAAASAPPAPPVSATVPVAVMPRPPIPVPVPAPPPAPVAVIAPPPPAPAPVVDLPPAVVAETLQAEPLAEPVAASWKASQPNPVTPIRGGLDDSSFGSISASSGSGSASGSQKALMAVAAAVVLVLGGAAGGYWFYSRQSVAAGAPAPLQAANTPPAATAPVLTPASAPVIDPAPPAPATVTHQPQMDVVEPWPAIATPVARVVQPAPAVRHNTVPIGQMKAAPKAKTTTARFDASEAPPAMMGAVNLGDTAANTLLIADPVGPAPPPSVGGQLQPPQLINSAALVYPPNARMQHLQGVVVLDALVDETGKVVETKVIAGPAPLLSAAQDSVRNWKYKPAQLNGKPIAVHTKVSVRFSLQ